MTLPVPPLLGIDVGFSKKRRTTGIAWYVEGEVDAIKTYSDWERRQQQLPVRGLFAVIAIDGPLLPHATEGQAERRCERAFISGPFQRRCKPGLSHYGTGLALRRAARETAEQFRHLVPTTPLPAGGPHVTPSLPIVEAFPNAFIGGIVVRRCLLGRQSPQAQKI
jgi:hypothetical protein